MKGVNSLEPQVGSVGPPCVAKGSSLGLTMGERKPMRRWSATAVIWARYGEAGKQGVREMTAKSKARVLL